MGIIFRINRSIQAEGAFSAMRVWLGLERISMWGAHGARVQAALFALAFNARKFHLRVQNNRHGKTLHQKTV
ncbi:MAG: transposase [Eubacteriaceae bacterium]|nr:transposase [Eubacteriaceae bacterium]